jgi:hypothetical protein
LIQINFGIIIFNIYIFIKRISYFIKILKSPELLKKKLIAELEDVGKKLSAIMDDKEKEKKKVFSKGGTSKPPSRTRQ